MTIGIAAPRMLSFFTARNVLNGGKSSMMRDTVGYLVVVCNRSLRSLLSQKSADGSRRETMDPDLSGAPPTDLLEIDPELLSQLCCDALPDGVERLHSRQVSSTKAV
jgi:hypothetical protein